MSLPRLIRLQPSGKELDYRAPDTVLETLERGGYALPNNCRAGTCGECKCKVTEGTFDQGVILDMALTDEERADGYALTCMAKPTSEELDIEYGTLDALPRLFPPRQDARFVVTDWVLRTRRIAEVRMRPLGDDLRFWPGQYIMVGDPKTGIPARQYSIANAPRPDGELSLLVALADGGATSAWIHHTVRPGRMLSVSGPYGTFVGDPGVDGPVLCLTAGSGLAPILSLAEAALRRGFRKPVTLVFSARHPDDVFEAGPVNYWVARHRRFKFVVCRTGAGELAPGQVRGRIPVVLPSLFEDLSEHSVFISGSPEFVSDCVEAASKLGARKELTYTEAYFPKVPAVTPPQDRLGAAGT